MSQGRRRSEWAARSCTCTCTDLSSVFRTRRLQQVFAEPAVDLQQLTLLQTKPCHHLSTPQARPIAYDSHIRSATHLQQARPPRLSLPPVQRRGHLSPLLYQPKNACTTHASRQFRWAMVSAAVSEAHDRRPGQAICVAGAASRGGHDAVGPQAVCGGREGP